MDVLDVFWESLGVTKEQRIFFMRTAWVAVVSIHIAWVCGWLTFAGFTAPFARADTLDAVATQIREERADALDHQIQQVRYQQCRTAIDSPQRQNYTERLNELYTKYVALTKKEPRVPTCDQT